MKSRQEIIDCLIVKYTNKQLQDEKVVQEITYEAMDIYAKEYTKDFIQRISFNPIDCYSQKLRGEEKQFFLGRNYVERLLKSLE